MASSPARVHSAYTQGYEAGDVELIDDAPDGMRFRILLQDKAWKNDLETAIA
jgi:hypothetical protein